MIHQVIEAIDNNNHSKQNLKRKWGSVYNSKIIADSVIKGQYADNIRLLIDAYEQRKQVILHNYSSAHAQNVSDRMVEPFAFTTNYENVWCYEPESNRNKLFRISRIESVEIINIIWKHETLHQEGFTDVFRMSSYDGEKYFVTLLLNRRAYNILIEEYPLAELDIKQISSVSWLFKTEVCNFIGITRFILGLAADIQIIDSPELKNFVSQYIFNNVKSLIEIERLPANIIEADKKKIEL